MKFGIIGGFILLILTIIFSTMAVENNKIAKEIVTTSFKLNEPKKEETISKRQEEINVCKVSDKFLSCNKEANSKALVKETIKNQEKTKWQEFDVKFDDFDKKFKDF